MNPIITLEKVSKKYKNQSVLESTDLDIFKGDSIGITGINGSGKTTLLKLILGFKPQSGGKIIINGVPRLNQNFFLSNAGFSFKEFGPIPNITGLANLKINAQLFKPKDSIDENSLKKLMQLFGLDHTDKHKVKDYSLGMRQRLSLATSLINDPEIVIWDEPCNSLDKAGQTLVETALGKLRETNKTIIITSHNQTFLQNNTTRLLELTAGSLKEVVRDE